MTSESTRSPLSMPFSQDEFAQALENYNYAFAPGQVVRGKVFEYASDGAYVDIGGKSSGFVPLREAAMEQDIPLNEALPLEAEFEFLIVSSQNTDGQVTLSRRQLLVREIWERIAETAQKGTVVEMRVTGTNRGGVIGEIEGLRGFIPRSHLLERVNLETLVGQLLSATFLEVDREKNKLVLSQREAARAAIISKLEPGQLVTGKVANIKPYGAFIDLGNATGLLHIKQVSGTRIEDLAELLQVGQSIKAMIIDLDESKNRISLSTKVLEKYPGEVQEKFEEVMTSAESRAEKVQGKLGE
ncbi:MAG: 30S ribosomal protein S1 [Chloroflexaceae bacterium]|nr:30S ribosomal protein S1 [Chloroflexaceae bacterium]